MNRKDIIYNLGIMQDRLTLEYLEKEKDSTVSYEELESLDANIDLIDAAIYELKKLDDISRIL